MKQWLVVLLAAGSAQAATVSVQVDTTQDRRALDPQIYGINFGEPGKLDDPGYTVRRWGGNSTTRYNWQADVHNTADDYFYQNIPDGNGQNLPNGSSVNAFLEETLDAGVAPILTISTIGWTPDPQRVKKWGFSIAEYGAQTQNECSIYDPQPDWCEHDAGNGECVAGPNCQNGRIVGNDPDDTSYVTDHTYARQWVAHLKQRHGTAANGGVRYYALDNEPMLWNSTHRDVHPQPATYDEIWQKTVAYAGAIKAEDPDAKIFGPVTWGYCDLFGSAADDCVLGDDRAAHGGVPFVQWYLRQVCAYEQQHGVRLVDYLDLHYYPQGDGVVDFDEILEWSENAENSAKRLRSLKELYDPQWVAESWFADLGDFDQYHYSKPQFLPRVRAWIDAECPGTKLAITEYDWGPRNGASSALAQAELLAIFAREGVDLATRWVPPSPGSRVERAFRLFLDYDGQGSRVIGDSVRAISTNIDALGAYAVDLPGERTMLLLFNKATTATTVPLTLNTARNGTWRLYRFDEDSDVGEAASGAIAGNTLTLANLPPRSANLLVLPSGALPPEDRIFADGFEE